MTDKDKYRQLCNREKSIPLFSRDWWLDIVCGETRWDVLLVEEKGEIQAAMPLYLPHRGMVSMPDYTQTMGPWFAPEPADAKYATRLGRRQALAARFTEALKAYPHFLQNFHYRITDWLPFYWAGYRQTTRYTYLIDDLSLPSDALWAAMSPQIRRNITKARDKESIQVRKGIPFDDFLHVQTLTFQRQGRRVPGNPDILRTLVDACRQREQGDLWGAYDAAGRIHAAVFLVWQESSAYYLAGGGDPAVRQSGAHSLVLWETIRFAAGRSERFDFEGSMLPGVERFFREFGAVQTPYFTLTKGRLSFARRAWHKLLKYV